MTIQDVHLYVEQKLLIDLSAKDELYIKKFIEALHKSVNVNDKRLLICLGIDLKNYDKLMSKDAESALIKILQKIILGTKIARTKTKSFDKKTITNSILFGISLNTTNFDDRKPILISGKDGSEYIRVTTFESYVRRIVIDNSSLNPTVAEGLDLNFMKKYYMDFQTRKRFNTLTIAKLSSSTGWVFLASLYELNQALVKRDLSEIIDSLGFYIENINIEDRYIWMKYPTAFNEIVYQPTSLTGDWGKVSDMTISEGNEFFLSYNSSDLWGRTFSVSGTKGLHKERTHYKIDGTNSYEFEMNDLGHLSNSISRCDDDTIITEALDRFTKAS